MNRARMKTVAKTSLATSLAVMTAGASGTGLAIWSFRGSDTLTEVVRDAIQQSGQSANLAYQNTGSSAGESNALSGGQVIVPMSRNWKSSVIASTAHPTWAPELRNVVGLDAGVIVQALNGPTGYASCKDLTEIALDADRKKAQNGNLLQLLLGGVDGAGTEEACKDQRRLDAIDYLQSVCFSGVSQIEHFWRRDDRSGTADTMKERLRIQRFCNGRAPGVDDSGADYNLRNDDADPVRRACIGESATRNKTVCTLWPATTHCEDTPTAAGCTQGFVVALSQGDKTGSDITKSIGERVADTGTYITIGFGGRAASRVPNATPSMITSVSPSDLSIRNGAYFLARRLFVNWADTNYTAMLVSNHDRAVAEKALYDWMTDPDGDPLPGRWNLDQIMIDRGFLPCTDDHNPPTDTGNLCNSEWPIPAAESTPPGCIPPGVNGDAKSFCCSTNAMSVAGEACPDYFCQKITQGCATTANCCQPPNAGASGQTLTCQDLGVGHNACCVGPNEAGLDCGSNAECCTNNCGPQAKCCQNTTGTVGTGASCTANSQCCSDTCSSAGKCCAYFGGSKAAGELCNWDKDCCSGSCSAYHVCN